MGFGILNIANHIVNWSYCTVLFVNFDIAAIWASSRENLSSGVCEQHRRRPACAFAQSDQRLCYSLL